MTLTIGRRLSLGFSFGIVVLAGLATFSIVQLTGLQALQHEGAGRAEDAVAATEAAGTVPKLYQVIADAVINRDLERAGTDWASVKKEMEGDIGALIQAADTPDEKRQGQEALNAHQELVRIVEGSMLPLLRESDKLPEDIARLDGEIDDRLEIMETRLFAIRDSMVAEAHSADAAFDSEGEIMTSVTVVVAVFAVIGLIATAFVTARGIVNPIRAMTEAMRRLAGGDKTVVVPATERGDEVGEMAQAVQVFKDNLIKADQLAAAQEAEREAKQRRAEAIERQVKAFEGAVADSLKTVAAATTQLQSTAQTMSATAEQTSRQSTAVATAAEEASTNVQTVASAAEELAASISEIGRQVHQSTAVSRTAASEAERTNETVQGLAAAAQKIGEVVSLINDIASQTNLLALNATIEAARAGDAGKGFAVVANEVKSLANQTARATEDITQQITSIQAATGQAVQAIQSIVRVVGEVGEISAAIAAAVEEQSAATGEISRNVQQAAAGTMEVTSNIAGVTRAAGETGAASTQVLGAAQSLSQQAGRLRQDVESFVTGIKAA